ncbi:LysR family transcriptional regulator [Limnohabitans sp. Hippo3]|uniref:LysR family transcriptional regulator n=1 Tax=Limnohabitans sp. Hippo3 TaxID=1597956 RepID=UPI001304D9F6|nr:LysR family transcriptional regulator [Limnohabitans sp. Hippo3]
MELDDLRIFVRVTELGTLSAVARERHAPVSQITRAMARLESALQVRLLHRSTHGLSLTDEGDICLAQARGMLDSADTLDSELGRHRQGVHGWVRVGVSALMAQCVVIPHLPALYAQHPGLHLDIRADDRMVDMARDGIDIAIRSGQVGNDGLVARKIGLASRSLYAAPSYLAQHGSPQQPDDLVNHHLIGLSHVPAMNRWQRLDTPQSLHVQGDSRVDHTGLLLSMVQHGVGISRLLDVAARPLVASGQLAPVLQGCFEQDAIAIYAVMLPERHRLPKIRACVDHWAAVLQGS